MQINESNWQFELYRRLDHPPMSRQIQSILHSQLAEEDRNRSKRRTPEYLKAANNYRLQRIKLIKGQVASTESGYKTTKGVFIS